MKQKKILVVVDSIDVNDSSGSKANVAFIQSLLLAGMQVEVFHYTRKEIQLNKIKCYSIKEIKFSVFYLLSRFQRVFTRITKIHVHKFFESNFGFSFTFFNDVLSIRKALKINQSEGVDLILTLSKAASFRPHYALIKLPELHEKWIAYFHDPYPFSCYPEPYNWEEPGFKFKEKFMSNISIKARYSSFPSLYLKEWMGSFFPNLLKSGIVIPHQLYEVKTDKNSLPDYFDSSKFNILHAGSLMSQRNPKPLIQAFDRLLQNNEFAFNSCRLILIGNLNMYKSLLENYSKKLNQLIVKTQQPFETIYSLQQKVSVNIILEAKADHSPFLPGKFPHCVKANNPIIHLGPRNSETMRLLGDDYCFHSEIDDVDKIELILEELFNKWMKNEELKLNRPDLVDYLSHIHLKEVLNEI